MRFHIGLPPDEFEPTVGWSALREPAAANVNWVSLPIGLILFGCSLAGWHLLGISVMEELQVSNAASVLKMIFGFVLLILVHELVHGCFHPSLGVSHFSVFGASFRPMVLYASYQASLTRNRFLIILLAPLAILTILPMVVHAAGFTPTLLVGPIAAASATNAALSSADVLGAFLVARQVPRACEVRNKGWQTYWRTSTYQGDVEQNKVS